jgi:hypothetical protein
MGNGALGKSPPPQYYYPKIRLPAAASAELLLRHTSSGGMLRERVGPRKPGRGSRRCRPIRRCRR